MSFQSVFRMKTVKSRLFKKYFEIKKSRAQVCLFLDWLTAKKKVLKIAILLLQDLRIWIKEVSFWANVYQNFTDIWRT